MSFIQRAVKVPPNSASLDEARHQVFDFFRAACRSIPTIMEMYNLDDVVTPSHLRSVVASEIRKNANVTNPKVKRRQWIVIIWYPTNRVRNKARPQCIPHQDFEKAFLELMQFQRAQKPKVIDMLLFKAMEELNNITEHAKQRHHIIGQYVVGQQGLVQDSGTKDQGTSAFLKEFYKSNYF